MFEHASLQELYTGSLIAGKGKQLNNIRVIMERSKLRSEDWARVRFGAGTPWRRCWCVIEPPDEKDFQRQAKSLKKRSAYDRPVVLKGDIKFYDTKKIKKALPIATITDAYSAYAIYPQSKPLIDQSTLVKVEGRITIHSQPESKTEGFVFVMPEVHPAVSGFEIMLRWLFPVYDTFNLYGRPARLIADTLDTRGLMFAMPKQKRYGYLDIIDVAGLIHTDGSKDWSEREWRKQLKEVTSRRMEMTRNTLSRDGSQLGSRKGNRNSMPSRTGSLRYNDNASIRSSPSVRHQHNHSADIVFATPQKAGTAPPGGLFPLPAHNQHARSVSESVALSSPSRKRPKEQYTPSRLSVDEEREAPQQAPPNHRAPHRNGRPSLELQNGRVSSDGDRHQALRTGREEMLDDLRSNRPPAPVTTPPPFTHQAGDRPQTAPNQSPEMRRANSRISTATLSQMVDATGMRAINGEVAAAGAAAAWKSRSGTREDRNGRGVIETPHGNGAPADRDLAYEAMVAGSAHNRITPPNPPQDYPQLAPPMRPSSIRTSSSKSVTRKPLPSRPSSKSRANSTTNEASAHSLPIPTDTASLIRVSTQGSNQYSSDRDIQGNPFEHDDDSSTDSPDYCSTRKSSDTKRSDKSILRPRTGVLKTVGKPELNENAPPMPDATIPAVDFGPTRSLAPVDQSRPSTSGSLDVNLNTQGRAKDHSRTPSGPRTPLDEKRLSSTSRSSPASASDRRYSPHSRSPSYADRAMAWQMGAVVGSGRQSPGGRVTPEDFVQQRANANRANPPGYVPQRNRSTGNLHIDRPASGEWSKRVETPPPPPPKGAMPPMSQADFSSRLSAREQEHLAKMTGSPLVNVGDRNETAPAPVGLVGAIQAREQEKRNMRESLSGQMVQHAIAQRQQQAYAQAQAQAQAQAHAQQAAQMAYGHSQQVQSFSDGRAPIFSNATWGPHQQPSQTSQSGNQQGQMYWGGVPPNQHMPPQPSRSYSDYYSQQNGNQR